MSIDLDKAHRSSIPEWCPSCGENNPTRYPLPLPGDCIGCQTCSSHWPWEVLAAIRQSRSYEPIETISVEDALFRIRAAVERHCGFPGSQVGLLCRFKEDLGISVEVLSVLCETISKEFAVSITREQGSYCLTVDDLIYLLRMLVAAQRRALRNAKQPA